MGQHKGHGKDLRKVCFHDGSGLRADPEEPGHDQLGGAGTAEGTVRGAGRTRRSRRPAGYQLRAGHRLDERRCQFKMDVRVRDDLWQQGRGHRHMDGAGEPAVRHLRAFHRRPEGQDERRPRQRLAADAGRFWRPGRRLHDGAGKAGTGKWRCDRRGH